MQKKYLFHLIGALLAVLLLSSCSLFSSDEGQPVGEIESGLDESDLEGLDEELEGDELAESDDLDLDEEDIEDIGELSLKEEDLLAEELGDEDLGLEDLDLDDVELDEELAAIESGQDDFLAIEKPRDSSPKAATPPMVGEMDDPVDSGTDFLVSSSSSGNNIQNLEYVSQLNGGTVLITADKPFTYELREEPEFNQVVVEVADVTLPKSLKRPYIAKDFGQPVATINAYQTTGSSTARFVIQYKTNIRPELKMKNNQLMVMTAPDGSGALAKKKKPAKRISIQVDDVNVQEVVKLIASESGVNIMIDKDVGGNISISLNDVPWDQALLTILRSRGLSYKRDGNILRVATQNRLAKEAENLNKQLVNEMQARRESQGRKVRFYPVNYADVAELEKKIKPFLSTGGQVSSDNRSSALVVVDFPDILDKVKKMIVALDIPPMQIMIEGKIVEASENFSSQIGANLGLQSVNDIGSQSLRASLSTGQDLTTLSGGLSADLSIGVFDVIGDLSSTLKLAEDTEDVKVLSSPRIMALNKEPAEITQTSQFPFTTPTPIADAGQVLNQVQFQDVKLSLKVTPQITYSGEILMNVEILREIPGAAVAGARRVEGREAKTKVLVPNGKTVVIGGIYQVVDNVREVGIPLLKDIPLLGYLFKSRVVEKNRNELLIFLTPKIINPELTRQSMALKRSMSPENDNDDGVNLDTDLEAELDDFESAVEAL